jgi:hypothetical protein
MYCYKPVQHINGHPFNKRYCSQEADRQEVDIIKNKYFKVVI